MHQDKADKINIACLGFFLLILTVGSFEAVALQAKAEMAMETANWSKEKTNRKMLLIPAVWEKKKRRRSNITKYTG